jgi:cobalamin biosynthetic protein CobC
LGFVVGDPALIARLADMLGPWPVSGPALEAGTTALRDTAWAEATRQRLRADAARLDQLAHKAGLQLAGGTDLFRLYETPDAAHWQERLAKHQIWSRSFSYAPHWLRLGLPPADGWARLEQALA